MINKPMVSPPGTLRLAFIFCIMSTIGTLLYSILATLTIQGSLYEAPSALVFVAILHLVLPIVIAYTIITNHPSSRFLIVAYTTLLSFLFLNQWQFPELVTEISQPHLVVVFVVISTVVNWLFRSRKMRYYYALIRHHPIPDDLLPYGDSLAGDAWLSDRLRSRVNWIADHLETVVLLGFIIVVFVAFGIMT